MLKQTVPQRDYWTYGACCSSAGYSPRQAVSREQVSVSEFKPPDYTLASWQAYKKREDDTPVPMPSITFAPLSETFNAPTPDFSGGGGDFGGGGASGDF
jgi:uncharacterized membrane protein YgcG